MRCLICGVPLAYYSSPEHARRPSCQGELHRFVVFYHFWWALGHIPVCKEM